MVPPVLVVWLDVGRQSDHRGSGAGAGAANIRVRTLSNVSDRSVRSLRRVWSKPVLLSVGRRRPARRGAQYVCARLLGIPWQPVRRHSNICAVRAGSGTASDRADGELDSGRGRRSPCSQRIPSSTDELPGAARHGATRCVSSAGRRGVHPHVDVAAEHDVVSRPTVADDPRSIARSVSGRPRLTLAAMNDAVIHKRALHTARRVLTCRGEYAPEIHDARAVES